jgi:hypothetical protein
MKRASLVILMALLLSAAGLLAQSRAVKKNDFTIELGGKCILYSLSYQRMVSEMFGLEVGASFLGGAASGEGGGIIFLSGGGRFYFIKKNASPTLSGGIIYVTAATTAGPFEGDSGVYFYANPGFEFRQSSGFVVRGGVYFLIKDGFFVWPGIQLGIAF